MTTYIDSTELTYQRNGDTPSIADSAGGFSVKPADQEQHRKAYKRMLSATTSSINLSLGYKVNPPEFINLRFTADTPTAIGRMRVSKLHKPFMVPTLDGNSFLVAADICTYLPSRTAIAGRYWVVVPTDVANHLMSLVDTDDLQKESAKITTTVLAFESFAGSIDGHEFTDIFCVTGVA